VIIIVLGSKTWARQVRESLFENANQEEKMKKCLFIMCVPPSLPSFTCSSPLGWVSFSFFTLDLKWRLKRNEWMDKLHILVSGLLHFSSSFHRFLLLIYHAKQQTILSPPLLFFPIEIIEITRGRFNEWDKTELYLIFYKECISDYHDIPYLVIRIRDSLHNI